MSFFLDELERRRSDPSGRRWLFVPYDQLTDAAGPILREDPRELGIVMVENRWKARRRPYHRQKLAWVLANGRHFALEQAARGIAVRYLAADAPYRASLVPLVRELGVLRMMEPAERELRADLEPLTRAGSIEVLPHEGWLTTVEQFRESQSSGPPWRMDAFYRAVRRETGILMDAGKPVGGKFSFDAENRRRWPGEPPAPSPPSYAVDDVKLEVAELIERDFSDHPGRLDMSAIAATRVEAARAWAWAAREALPLFGPFEDAMSVRSRTLFHTLVSPLMNLSRLLPRDLIADVVSLDIPLASKEGFIRQVLGWREFMRHVHLATDGFRRAPTGTAVRADVGDGGLTKWRGRAWETGDAVDGPDGGAAPSALESHADVPPAFWGAESGLECLDQVVREVWQHGYGHHITRLMVLSNLATLLDLEPRDVTDWFWVAYIDAYDWVVEPNVLAMGTFGTGDLVTTKPYVSGAAYINKMSDYCGQCRFDPKRTCPITPLYWAFLNRHREQLAGVQRMRLPLASAAKRSASAMREDQALFERVRAVLARGDVLMLDR
jgi:deoxyribodipyrimidine photolyase-related protein